MDELTAKGERDRSHIAINDTESLRRWAKHFEATEDELRDTIERVGNSAAAVRKEINARKADRPACEQPPPEEEFGGGDIVSLETEPSTDDDQPL